MTADPRATLQHSLSDRYRIERELGRGGMAVVYLAHDVRHDRPVALKVLHAELAHALGPERFEREIHVAARLQHPHILTVLDSGDAGGLLWFAMPFVEGESLRSRLAREGQLPVDDAIRIAREAADALDYAHRHGIIHRDIKPDNILLSDGHALVADFGIARALAGGDEHLTATGTSIGTAAYMSPEQAAGERQVDGRSDIFSLGVVLYEMLAGTTPFAAATPQAMIARRFTEEAAPIRQHRASVPEPVERALHRALARTAADRFPTARAFSDALGAAPVPSVSTVPPVPFRRRTPSTLVLATGLLIGIGALFAWSRFGNGSGDRDPTAELRAGSAKTGAVRIAVLPFENLGDSADGYFADGVTDAVRSKLAGIGGFAVIARGSSQEYRGSVKPASQIAEELGVHYILTGTVRWVKQPDGTSRVQVRPELVEIGDGTAQTRWGEPFNAALTDVFEVQEQIAGRVSGALNVALATPDKERLAERPTDDLEAYKLFLQAEAITSNDPANARRAESLLKQAVARDSTFGVAWGRLASMRAFLNVTTTSARFSPQELRVPLDRAMALAPDAPTTYRARANFAQNVEQDLAKALAISEEAVRRHPNDPLLLRALGLLLIDRASPDSSIAILQRAVALDPRNVQALRALGVGLAQAGRFAEAREPLQRVLGLAPGDFLSLSSLMQTWLGEGDLTGARRAVNAVNPPDGRRGLLAYLTMFGDFFWVLDPAQQDTVMQAGVELFDGDAGSHAFAFAQILHLRGDTAGARRHAVVAFRDFDRVSRTNPDPQLHGLAGMALALQGRHDDARSRMARAISASAESDFETRGYNYELSARASMLAGDREAALTALEKWVETLGPRARGRARLHPEFAPLRGNPRFERLATPARSPA